MLDLQHLETFRVVAFTNNFTRAAKVLGCCQSTVTTHIMALERELGASVAAVAPIIATTIEETRRSIAAAVRPRGGRRLLRKRRPLLSQDQPRTGARGEELSFRHEFLHELDLRNTASARLQQQTAGLYNGL